MKKVLVVVLALAMILSFVACGDDNNGKDEKVAYILAQKGDTYSLGLANNFKEAFEKQGGVTVMEEFPEETKNFTDYLQKALDKKADVIFAPNSTTVAANLLKNAQDAGITCPILAGDTWESSVILDGAKGAEFDVYVSTFFDENDNTTSYAKDFVTGYKAWLNANADKKAMNGGNDIVAAVSALGFDAYNAALLAIRNAASVKGDKLTSVDIATALWTLDYKEAVAGPLMFDQNGDAIKNSAYIKKAGDGAFIFEKVQTVENNATQGKAVDYGDAKGIALDTVNKKIVIGIYEPTSGDNAAGGKQEVLGVQYANYLDHTVVINGVNYEVEVYLSDNGSKEENAAAAASALVAKNALVVLGSYGSGVSIAAANTFEQAQIPAIGISCTNAAVTIGKNYYFRTCFLDPFQGSVMADFAMTLIK